MGDFDFETRHFVGARLAGSPVIKIVILLAVSRTTVSKVMSVYTTHYGKTTPAKRNSGRKSILIQRDRRTLRRIISKNHTTTAAQVNCGRTEYLS
jgi:hypothetical protein